ncbi:MAG TPA: methyltransferase domain-containing protein [Beijerinckiaceae bacterium]|nr:methyltransferase domain-containing protein [Beijerinckiaceae bacterium]
MSVSRTTRSSGDLLADRRYGYADTALTEGDFAAAADLALQVLELAPDYAPAHALLGRARAALADRDGAVEALSRALACDPDDALGVRLDLARLGALAPESAITPGYVRALFDDYAPRFDRHLVRSLDYRGPELIHAAVHRAATDLVRPARFARMLDLGCGTGLVGRAFADHADLIEGIDLSPGMLARARKTRAYAALHEGELVTALRRFPDDAFDLVTAADVLVYISALEPVFGEVRRVVAPRGLFAFTVEACAGADVLLGDGGRYAHSRAYLRRLAADAGFEVARLDEVSTREDRGEAVPGFLAVLAVPRRRGAPDGGRPAG